MSNLDAPDPPVPCRNSPWRLPAGYSATASCIPRQTLGGISWPQISLHAKIMMRIWLRRPTYMLVSLPGRDVAGCIMPAAPSTFKARRFVVRGETHPSFRKAKACPHPSNRLDPNAFSGDLQLPERTHGTGKFACSGFSVIYFHFPQEMTYDKV